MSSWLGTREACDHLGISLRVLYRAIDEGALPAYKMGRLIRLRRQDVEDYGRRHGGPGGFAGDRAPRRPPPAPRWCGSESLDVPG